MLALSYGAFAQVGPPQSTNPNTNNGYGFAQSSGAYVPLTAGKTVWQSGATLATNGVSGSINLPSPFKYNGKSYSVIYISNNGFITFGSAPVANAYTGLSTNSAVPNLAEGAVAGFANNLINANTTTSEIAYEAIGGRFIVQFTDLKNTGGSATQLLNFQIQLDIINGSVQIVYGNCVSGTAITTGEVGLRGADGRGDVNNRLGTDWTATTPGTANSSICTLGITNGTTVPANGLTFTYTPGTWIAAPTTYATLPFTENFSSWANGNSTGDLPNIAYWRTWPSRGNGSWRQNDLATADLGYTGTSGWYENTEGTPTAIAAPAVAPTARFHSYYATAGQVGNMDLYVDLSSGGSGVRVLSFDYRNASGTDKLEVLYSTDGGVTFISVGSLTTNSAWTKPSYVINSTAANAILRLSATADYGSDDIFVDNLNIIVTTTPPACTTTTAPLNNATGVSITPTVTWAASVGASSYKINLGTVPGGTDVLNSFDVGNVLTYTIPTATPLMYGKLYYVTVLPTNSNGTASGCTEFSFTTKNLNCPSVTAPSSSATGVSTTPAFTWGAVTDATGYKLTIGTTAGGNNILNAFDLGNVTTYTLPTPLVIGTKYFYTINAYNSYSSSLSCTERNFTTLTLCPTVSAPVSSATGVSINPTFTWAVVNNVTGYRISIGTTSGGTDVLNSFDVGNVLTYTLPTPLNNSTQYYYTIVGYIGTQVSSGCSERSFFTVCSSTNVPYTLDFESVTTPSLPLCTAVLNVGSGNAWKTAAAPTGVGFTGKVLNNSYNSNNAANTWFFTQGLNLTAGVSYRIKYKYANSSGTNQYLEKLKVAYGSAATVAGMTNVLATHETTVGAPTLPSGTTINTANLTDGFYTLGVATSNFVDFTPASTGVYYFGFNAYSIKNMNQIYVDDINIDVTPTCFEPTAVAVASITTSGASVSWTAPSAVPNNGYEVYYSTSSIAPTASTVLNATNSTTSASTSAAINGLSPATTYYAWVRSVCSSTDKSIWSISVIFTTSCVSVTTLNENFDTTAVGSLPPCWTSIGSTLTYAAVNASSSMSAPNVLYIYTSGTSTGMVSTPVISTLSTGNYSVAFKGRANSTAGGIVQIGYLTDPALTSSFVSLGSYTATSTTVVDNFILPITGVPAGVTNLVLKHTGTPSYSVYIDNFRYDLTSVLSASEASSVKVDNIKVYPNPFADVLNISDVKNIKSISIVDIAGRVVKTIEKPSSSLQLRELNSGMYMVILNMNDGSRQTIKAIKK